MSAAEDAYKSAGNSIEGADDSQMFGKPCFKIEGKAFASFFQDEMAFKLSGEDHANALSLEGAKLFDPGGKGRPFKAWVQVPFEHVEHWGPLAQVAAGLLIESQL